MSKGLEVLQEYRNESGRRIYEAGLVRDGIIWHVRSESDVNTEYDIEDNEEGFSCNCPDSIKRPFLVCKHRVAVEQFILNRGVN